MAKFRMSKNLFEGLTLVRTKNGEYKLRRKGIDGKRIKTDPSYERAREHAQEFGRAGKTVKLLRQAFMYWINKLNEPRLTGRMIKAVLDALKADSTSNKGERNLLQGHPEMLEGFKFNTKQGVREFKGASVSINRKSRTATVQIAPFYPKNGMSYQNREMYYRIISICGMLDMDTLKVETDMQISELFLMDDKLTNVVTLTNKIKTGKTWLNFLAVGVEFCYRLCREEYPVAGGSNDPLTIIKVIRSP
jgi:hypothetical protein